MRPLLNLESMKRCLHTVQDREDDAQFIHSGVMCHAK
jgi:hypothetical protein